MKEEIKTIKVIIDSMQQEISFKLRTNNLCILTLRFPDGEEYEVISDDFFSCLVDVRNKYPDIVFLCKGAKLNVYPSRMSRQMGQGLIAYEYTMGKQTRKEDMVQIFDFEDKEINYTPEEQKQNFYLWLNSFGTSQ